jgi:hypothetical protein
MMRTQVWWSLANWSHSRHHWLRETAGRHVVSECFHPSLTHISIFKLTFARKSPDLGGFIFKLTFKFSQFVFLTSLRLLSPDLGGFCWLKREDGVEEETKRLFHMLIYVFEKFICLSNWHFTSHWLPYVYPWLSWAGIVYWTWKESCICWLGIWPERSRALQPQGLDCVWAEWSRSGFDRNVGCFIVWWQLFTKA